MCIIVIRPHNHTLPEELLSKCFKVNDDGWGIMYAKDNEAVVHRGMDLPSLLETYRSLPGDLPLAIHFRWRTHGATDLANTHPYSVLSKDEHGIDLWCMHNGVIQSAPLIKREMSDTWNWIEYKVRPLLRRDPAMLQEEFFQEVLEDGIDSSRIVFMDNTGAWTFLNKQRWVKRHECYFSTTPPSLTEPVTGTYHIGQYHGAAKQQHQWDRFSDYEELDYAYVGNNGFHAEAPAAVNLVEVEVISDDRHCGSASCSVTCADCLVDEGDQRASESYELTFGALQHMSFRDIEDLVLESPEVVADYLYTSTGR